MAWQFYQILEYFELYSSGSVCNQKQELTFTADPESLASIKMVKTR